MATRYYPDFFNGHKYQKLTSKKNILMGLRVSHVKAAMPYKTMKQLEQFFHSGLVRPPFYAKLGLDVLLRMNCESRGTGTTQHKVFIRVDPTLNVQGFCDCAMG